MPSTPPADHVLRLLAAADHPVLPAHDHDGVHRRYGPVFGPWLPVAVAHGDGPPLVELAVGGGLVGAAGADGAAAAALRAAARDWLTLAAQDGPGSPAARDEPTTVADVALRAPHGLLVRHGVARLWGSTGTATVLDAGQVLVER